MFAPSTVPLVIEVSPASLPAVGGAAVYYDYFVMIAPEVQIDRIYLYMKGSSVNFNRQGTITAQFVQDIGDGEVASVTSEVNIDQRSSAVIQLLPAGDVLSVGRPMYCRIRASAPSSGPAVWYASAGLTLHGSIHLRHDNERVRETARP